MPVIKTISIDGIAKEVVEDQILRACDPKFRIDVEEMTQYFIIYTNYRNYDVTTVTIKEKVDNTIIVIIFYSTNSDVFDNIYDRLTKYQQIGNDEIDIRVTEDTII